MSFLDRFRKEKPFPEKGTFKGVEYRIDGDEVILRCSSGRELAVGPSYEIDPEEFDQQRITAEPELYPMEPFNLAHSATTSNIQTDADPLGDFNLEQVAAAYGIPTSEHSVLVEYAHEIIRRYWRTHKIPQKK